MTAGAPSVTVGLPVFNGEVHLAQALDSLLAQDHRDLELLVSDNASTDGTSKICEAYAGRDPRVQYRRLDDHVAAEPNFNAVLERARGTYFMWAAADDLWEPQFVSTAVRKLESDPGVALAFSAFDNISDEGAFVRDFPALQDLPHADRTRRLLRYLEQPEGLGKANPIYSMFRRSQLLDAGGMQRWADTGWGADMLVVFKMLSYGDIAVDRRVLFHKRLPPIRREGGGQGTPVLEALRERDLYLAGYRRVIRSVGGFPAGHRTRLEAAVVRRRVRDACRLVAERVRARVND